MTNTQLSTSRFPAPKSGNCDLLIIAGEHSGDQHAAHMLTEIKTIAPDLSVCALGGPELKTEGAQILYDLTAVSVVGFVEVIKQYGFFKRLFEKTLAWIREYRPKQICLIDYPGFNLRLAEKLFQEGLSVKGGGDMEVAYYIGPQIWAWKRGRRFAMSRILDKLAVIFPFEVECFSDVDLPVTFVGHPFLRKDYALPVEYAKDGKILLLPGSRRQAVRRIFPILLDAFQAYKADNPKEEAIVIYPDDYILGILKEELKFYGKLGKSISFVDSGKLVKCKAVLTSSGTMSLNCVLAGVPGAIVYRANLITYFIGKLLIKIPYLGISNILLKRPVYPEFIQGAAKSSVLKKEIDVCVKNEMRIEATQHNAELLRKQLASSAKVSPAKWLLGSRLKIPDCDKKQTSDC